MLPRRIGILHPGEMGISVAAALKNNGHSVYWVSEGRSADTRTRAEKFGLTDAHTLPQLCAECSTIVSVCPPHAAETITHQVVAVGFKGLYLDANAISPKRAIAIGQTLANAEIAFVDGAIIGAPAWKSGGTALYLSGAHASEIAACFAASPFVTRVLSANIGEASALKICYSAYSKGTTALLSAILATAETWGVREALYDQWAEGDASFATRTQERIQRSLGKAWRFVGEMEEISATFGDAGMPEGFHAAAADVYRRLAHFKDVRAMPSLNDVLDALRQTEDQSHH
jgi:3-hydroxyisobutyrate dehydrogenase-like beta-hydroxyacid dehydrogenase